MDGKTFDTLARSIGLHRTRRSALKGIAAGLFGLGAAKGAVAAEFGAERATCGQRCRRSSDCNSGFTCGIASGRCVLILATLNNCTIDANCQRGYEVCKGGKCVNQMTCTECFENGDCPRRRNGSRRCRGGTCRV